MNNPKEGLKYRVQELEILAKNLRIALTWYVDNDDTRNVDYNQFYLEGLNSAREVLQQCEARLGKLEEET
jgi:hypothetical protein